MHGRRQRPAFRRFIRTCRRDASAPRENSAAPESLAGAETSWTVKEARRPREISRNGSRSSSTGRKVFGRSGNFLDRSEDSAAVLNFLDRVQGFFGSSKKFRTAPRVSGRFRKAQGRSKKFLGGSKNPRSDRKSFAASKKIPGGSGKSGAVQKDFGAFQKFWTRRRPIFSLQKRREARNQPGGGPIFFAGAQEEGERCGGVGRSGTGSLQG